jgi:hypothetical protein
MSNKPTKHFVTVVTTEGPCGKLAQLSDDGTVSFSAAVSRNRGAVRGLAKCLYVPTADTLLAVLQSLQANQYILPDYVQETTDGEDFLLVEAWEHAQQRDDGKPFRANSGKWMVCMNKVPGVWRYGAWRVLDRDVDAHVPEMFRVPYADWLALVDKHLLPGLLKAPRVLWPSSKTRVRIAGGQPVESMNGHTWFDAAGGGFELTDEIRGRLRVQAVLAEVSWTVPRRSKATGEPLGGKGLDKTLFDLAIWTIHRQLYAGAPHLEGEGLELVHTAGEAMQGTTPVNLLKAVPELEAGRVDRYSKAVGVRAAVNRRIVDYTEVVRLNSVDRKTLNLSTEVELMTKTGSLVTTLHAFIRNTEFEFKEKHRCQAPFRASSSWNGIIRKYPYGQVMVFDNGLDLTYWLPLPDCEFVCNQYTQALAEGDGEALEKLGKAIGSWSESVWQQLHEEVKKQTGISKVSLEGLRKHEKKVRVSHGLAEFFLNAVKGPKPDPVDLAELRSGKEILKQLMNNWILVLGARNTEAATFLLSPNPGHGSSLRFSSFTIPGLKTFTQAYPLMVVDKVSDQTTPVPVVDAWLNNPLRSGATRISFEPGFPSRFDGVLNLWQDWPLVPKNNPAGCAMFLQHVREVIANGDQKVYDYVLNWLATRVQGIANRKPGKELQRLVVCVVLRGLQGAGKGQFEKYIAKIFGTHALVTQRGSGLVGRFNNEFAHLVLLCADEAFFAGDHQSKEALKSFLSEPVFSFEQKFKDSVSLPNHCAVVMSTNNEWAVPAEAGDRRYCVLDVSESRIGDREYFNALHAEYEGEGPAALFGYLLDRDLTGFDLRDYPKTQALREQQLRTMGRDDPTLEWLDEALQSGEVHLVVDDLDGRKVPFMMPWGEKPLLLPRKYGGEAVRKYASDTRKFSPPSTDAIGRSFKKVLSLGATEKASRISLGIHCTQFDNGTYEPPRSNSFNKVRLNIWELPNLEDARKQFQKFIDKGSRNL